MKGYLGIDTSNYTTSTAVYCPEHDLVLQKKEAFAGSGGCAWAAAERCSVSSHGSTSSTSGGAFSGIWRRNSRSCRIQRATGCGGLLYALFFSAGMSAARAICVFFKGAAVFFFSPERPYLPRRSIARVGSPILSGPSMRFTFPVGRRRRF